MGKGNENLGELINEGMDRSAVSFRRLTGYSVENGTAFEGRNARRESSEKAGARAMISGIWVGTITVVGGMERLKN